MKKLVFLIMAVVTTAGLNAQEAAKTSGTDNKMWLGGSVGFGTDNTKDGQSSSNWNFGPSFGYFLNEKMAIGLGFNIAGSTNEQNDTDEEVRKSMGWEVAPFFRYYFAGAGNFKFFGDALIGFGGGSNTYEDNTPTSNESKYSTFGVGVRPGIQYWFNNNWSMTSTIGLLGYRSTTNNKDEVNADGSSAEVVSTSFDLNANFSTINFSLLFHFQSTLN